MELRYRCADMAELADARGSGPRSRKGVEVQVLLSAPKVFTMTDYYRKLSVVSSHFLERSRI